MKRILFLTLILCMFLLPVHHAWATDSMEMQQEKVLAVAEKLFVAMKSKNYQAIWTLISAKTQNIIIKDVRKENQKVNKENPKANLDIQEDVLINDFISGGVNSKAYWNGFLSVFNPDIVLDRCKWDMGKITKNEAKIILQYKTAEKPAILKMFKEDGKWKVGLEESFGARRLMPF